MIFDVPRITNSLRNALQPVNSAVIYNTDSNRYEYYNGTSWKTFGEGSVISFNTRTGAVTLQDSDIYDLGDFTVNGTLTINNDVTLGQESLKIKTSAVDPNIDGVVAAVGSLILKNDGTLWQKLGTGNKDWSMIQTSSFTNEPTGFPINSTTGEIDRTSSTISFSDNDRTFSIAPSGTSYIILIQGRQYRKTTTESLQISTTEGLHYIYFNTSGSLAETTSFSLDLILHYAIVAIVYWDSTNNKAILFGDERHGCTMDSHTHARIHADGGAIYVSGMSPGDYVTDGDGNSESHITFSITEGKLRDEDILHTLSAKTTSNPIPIFYREGTNWRSITPNAVNGTYARAIGSAATPGIIAYNYFNGSSWSRVSVTQNYYVCYHVIGTNDVNNPYIILMGNDEYNTRPAATTGAISEIASFTALPFAELTLIATFLFQYSSGNTNSLKAKLVPTDNTDYEDWRLSKTLNPTTAAINSHNNLGGIYGAYPFYHSDQPIGTTDSPTFNSLILTGNLTVNGTTTTINTETLRVEDKNIELGIVASPGSATDITADGGGITLKGDTDKTLNWINSTDSWTSSENIDLASGKTYKINNTNVLTSTQVLGKSVPTGDIVGTSDSQTLTNKTLQGYTLTSDITATGTAIDVDLIDNNASALSFDTSGKTGLLEIDTTNSLEKIKMSGGLEVTGTSTLGNVSASGTISLNNLTYPVADGTNGQALVTNGSGVLSFGTVSGGGAGLTYQITSAPLVSLKVGMPVYWNGTNYAPANANTILKIPTAIVKELNVGDYTVQFGGTLTLTNAQWNQITEGTGGLSTSSGTNTYYLGDVNDGTIKNVSPLFSIPVLNCIKNDGTNSTVEIKFGTLSSTLSEDSYNREREVFTGNGSNLTFTLTLTPYSRNTTLVTIDGVVQQSNAFSISNKNIVFSEAPPANSEIEVNYVTQKNLNYANINKYSITVSGSETAIFTLPVTPNSENEVMAWIGGSYQDNSNFTLSGNILTFDTAVSIGTKVQFIIFSSVQFTDFPYIKRKSTTISNSSTKTLIDVFGNQASGKYDFHLESDPLIGGTIRLQEANPINVRVETFSTDISSTASTNNKLNIYINGSGNLEFQNLLGSSINIILERHQ